MARYVSLDLGDEMVHKLDELARVEERSRTSLIKVLLKRALIDAFRRLGSEDRQGDAQPAAPLWE